jgi:hypothetical protein
MDYDALERQQVAARRALTALLPKEQAALLRHFEACLPACAHLVGFDTLQEAWDCCEDPHWMSWLMARLNIDPTCKRYRLIRGGTDAARVRSCDRLRGRFGDAVRVVLDDPAAVRKLIRKG